MAIPFYIPASCNVWRFQFLYIFVIYNVCYWLYQTSNQVKIAFDYSHSSRRDCCCLVAKLCLTLCGPIQLSKTSGFTLLFLWSYPRIDSETKVKGCKQRSFAGLIDMSANVPKSWSMWKSLGSLFRMLTPNTHPFGFSRPRSWSVGIWQTSQGTGGRWSMDPISSNSVWITWSRRSITTLTEETSGTFDSQTASALVSLSLLNDFLYFPLVYQ